MFKYTDILDQHIITFNNKKIFDKHLRKLI
jgi:hypothetical protein